MSKTIKNAVSIALSIGLVIITVGAVVNLSGILKGADKNVCKESDHLYENWTINQNDLTAIGICSNCETEKKIALPGNDEYAEEDWTLLTMNEADCLHAAKDLYIYKMYNSLVYSAERGEALGHSFTASDGTCTREDTVLIEQGKLSTCISNPGKWYYFGDGTSGTDFTYTIKPQTDRDGNIYVDLNTLSSSKCFYLRYQPDATSGKEVTISMDIISDAAAIIEYDVGGGKTEFILVEGVNHFEKNMVVNDVSPFYFSIRTNSLIFKNIQVK